MANNIYGKALTSLLKADLDGDTMTVKVMLMNSTYDAIALETRRDSHQFRSDISANEISGTNYTAGGQTLTGLTVLAWDGTNNIAGLDADNPVWTNLTATFSGAVFYKDTGNAATDILLGYIDTGDQSITAADFTLTIPAAGFFALDPKAGS